MERKLLADEKKNSIKRIALTSLITEESPPKIENDKPTMQLPLKVISKAMHVKKKQHKHLLKLTVLADAGEWQHLQTHTAHVDSGFDWWMFPTDRVSRGYGKKYQLNSSEIEALKADPAFIKSYREGVLLVAKSWGWDLEKRQDLTNQVQKWTNYQVRLGKMLDSLRLFKQQDLSSALSYFLDAKGISSSLEPWIQKLLLNPSLLT